MMEPTVTQNNALYFVQHKIPTRRAGVLRRLGLAAKKWRRQEPEPEIRGNLFRWPRIQWQT
jgi:hypothetical protein